MSRRRPAPSQQTLEAERQVLEMRRAGIGIADIARRLNIPKSTAMSRYKAGMARTLRQPANEIREPETDRLDRLQVGLWAAAVRGDLGSIDRVLRIMERRARLLGLDHADGIAERALRIEQDKARLVAIAFGRALDAVQLTPEQRETMTQVLLQELTAIGELDPEQAETDT